jgi:hypothetical protein
MYGATPPSTSSNMKVVLGSRHLVVFTSSQMSPMLCVLETFVNSIVIQFLVLKCDKSHDIMAVST